jgi:hypothetical protein
MRLIGHLSKFVVLNCKHPWNVGQDSMTFEHNHAGRAYITCRQNITRVPDPWFTMSLSHSHTGI